MTIAALALFLAAKTMADLRPVAKDWQAAAGGGAAQILTREGIPLSVTYQNRWNLHEQMPLWQMPDFLVQAFLLSEDKRFYAHGGVDWQARASALWQNLRHVRTVRGASTISEQVVRMLHPRPRTLWSKWLEGWEAYALEKQASKAQILEFYLNQLPYAANRRGIAQAARYYFDRSPDVLSRKEMLALAVLARAPSAYDLYRDPRRIEGGIARLAAAMEARGLLNPVEREQMAQQALATVPPMLPVEASHFVSYVRGNAPEAGARSIRTTLDATLQAKAQALLDQRLRTLKSKKAQNGAILVADHTTGEILAWVVGGAGDAATPAGKIDAVLTPRQPGSALKPFVYALALQKGWTAATLIEDSPLAEAVGTGLHRFDNYSRVHYGKVSLRDALGNSLNIPAVRAVAFTGVENYLNLLHRLGFESLTRDADIYDEGLALGNGEVTLLEITRAYAALAEEGRFRPLHFRLEETGPPPAQVMNEAAASLIGNILSDAYARRLEFGRDSVLNLPVQTAVKTGTSSDYRDAWAMGYNYRYVVGVWLGNLDHSPMDGVTGSTGPALVLRGVFNELTRSVQTQSLRLHPLLARRDVCVEEGEPCRRRSEYFLPGTAVEARKRSVSAPQITQPTEGLQMAWNPRVPPEKQAFAFALNALSPGGSVEWVLDGKPLIISDSPRYLWPLVRGRHTLHAVLRRGDAEEARTENVHFVVK